MILYFSYATAIKLGILSRNLNLETDTAYLMFGDICENACAFCAKSIHKEDCVNTIRKLSRILWIPVKMNTTAARKVFNEKSFIFKRLCIQVVKEKGIIEKLLNFLKLITIVNSRVKISVSCFIKDIHEAELILKENIDTLTIPIDLANEELCRKYKKQDFNKILGLILKLAEIYKSRIGTHLIYGLGESEKEIIDLFYNLISHKVSIGLFAFTPVKGTPLGNCKTPDINSYRRVQTALFLLKKDLNYYSKFVFDTSGVLKKILLKKELFFKFLNQGLYMTSGCPNCLRPYYNDRPGKKRLYNYHRPLTSDEINREYEIMKNLFID